ncbi:hypothetical protein C8R43DRAFT_994511 [Mycena crocata]|nr:hypothetical protein C8R43DRAFT_994511 [Mycena crocata]
MPSFFFFFHPHLPGAFFLFFFAGRPPMSANGAAFSFVWSMVKSQVVVASAALFMHGVFMLLFVLALSFLLRSNAQGKNLLLITSILLFLFAVLQVSLDVSLAAIIAHLLELKMREGITPRVVGLMSTFKTLYSVRQGALATNNAIADTLFLYRCSVIWASYRYAAVVIIAPFILIIASAAVAYATIYFVWDVRIPFLLSLMTNIILVALAAGRIWAKRREAAVVSGQSLRKQYGTTIKIILESGFLYVAGSVLFTISMTVSTAPYTGFQDICWGALAQLVNIVPMIIIVRVSFARKTPEAGSKRLNVEKESV